MFFLYFIPSFVIYCCILHFFEIICHFTFLILLLQNWFSVSFLPCGDKVFFISLKIPNRHIKIIFIILVLSSDFWKCALSLIFSIFLFPCVPVAFHRAHFVIVFSNKQSFTGKIKVYIYSTWYLPTGKTFGLFLSPPFIKTLDLHLTIRLMYIIPNKIGNIFMAKLMANCMASSWFYCFDET